MLFGLLPLRAVRRLARSCTPVAVADGGVHKPGNGCFDESVRADVGRLAWRRHPTAVRVIDQTVKANRRERESPSKSAPLTTSRLQGNTSPSEEWRRAQRQEISQMVCCHLGTRCPRLHFSNLRSKLTVVEIDTLITLISRTVFWYRLLRLTVLRLSEVCWLDLPMACM